MKKRWFIFVIILVIIAVILTIVFINLFREKDTTALAENVNDVTQNGYLSEENEANQAIDAYLAQVSGLGSLEADRTTIENYADAYAAFEVIGDFFSRQIVFTENTSVYRENRGRIRNAFQRAQNAVDDFAEYLSQNMDVVGSDEDWMTITWANCKGYMQDIISNTTDAVTRLALVYQDCVTSKVMNNAMSDIIFAEIEKWTSQLISEETVSTAGLGQQLLTFVNAYLTIDGENVILQFQYDNNIKSQAENINELGEESTFYSQFVAGLIEVTEGV